MINYEVQAGVARILATENLVVEHRKCDTAQFDVHTRVLTLPKWEKASPTVFDLLVAHEVGHALYTPNIDWIADRKIPPNIVNIVEDARIEKLMKRRYGGLPKIFYRGYSEMQQDDFFELKDDDLSTYSFPDRINLYFKVGNFYDIQFDADELPIVEMVENAETFDDVLDAAEAVYEKCKKPQDSSQENAPAEIDPSQSGGGSDFSDTEIPQDSSQGEQNQDGEQSESEQDSEDADSGSTVQSSESSDQDTQTNQTDSGAGKGDGTETRTDSTLNDKLSDLNSRHKTPDNTYLEFPDLVMENVIASNSEIHDYIDQEFAAQLKAQPEYYGESIFASADSEYKKYKSESIKEVNYLVKEFECKKSADAYARATVSKTGVLDCSKLHTYKYNEDLFKKVTTIPDGKNHGLIFILDWSGSMGTTIIQTVKQLFNLVNFCKKCNIPFDVYAFTQNWKVCDDNLNYHSVNVTPSAGKIRVEDDFTLMNILSSSVSNRVIEKQMKNIWRVVYGIKMWTPYGYPPRLSLSGTPLNETMCALRKIIPEFQKKNGLQKTHCIVLTDGEGNTLQYHKEVTRRSYHDGGGTYTQIGTATAYYTDGEVFLRNRATGKVYRFRKSYAHSHQDTLLEALQDEFPNVNFIGFRILESGHEAGKLIQSYCDYTESEKLMSSWKKNKVFSITSSPYNSYFGLSNSALQNDVDYLDNLDDGATKTQIRAAMRKTLAGKKMNKKILSEFIDLVA